MTDKQIAIAAKKLSTEITLDETVGGIFPKRTFIQRILGKKITHDIEAFRARFGIQWPMWRAIIQKAELYAPKKVRLILQALVKIGDKV